MRVAEQFEGYCVNVQLIRSLPLGKQYQISYETVLCLEFYTCQHYTLKIVDISCV
jgi:hypothetical protein